MKKGDKVKVYVNGMIKNGVYEKYGERKLIEVEVINVKSASVRVKLPDGNVIRRKKNRDFPQEKTK